MSITVTAVFNGILADWTGAARVEFKFSNGATMADLAAEIGTRFRESIPDQLWNDDKNSFAAPVLATINGDHANNTDKPLPNGAEIGFHLLLAGG